MFGREWRSRELLIGGDFAHNETPARAGIPSRRGGLPPKCGEDTWTLQGGCPTESDERSGLAPVIAAVLSAYHVICFFPRSLIELAPKASSRLRKRGPQRLAEMGCASSISACGRSTSLSTARSTGPYSVTTYCM